MQHIVSIAFDFDDEKVTKSIEGQVHEEVVNNITKEIKQIIYKKSWSGGKYDDPEPLKNMVENNVRAMIDSYKDIIIEMATNKLADSLKRSKAVKEVVGNILKD